MGYYLVLGGSFTVSIFAISLTSLPQAIHEFKSSSLLKRIGATPIKPWVFISVTSLFYIFTMFISLFWTMVMTFIIFCPYVSKPYEISIFGLQDLIRVPSLTEMYSSMDWVGFLISQLLTMLVGITCGFTLVSISKSSVTIQAMGVLIFVISLLLDACLFPPYLIKREDIMPIWWIGYFLSPFKSTTNMSTESWYWHTACYFLSNPEPQHLFNVNQSTIFDCSKAFVSTPMIYVPGMKLTGETTICEKWEKIIDWIIPFCWTGLFSLIAIKKFRWTTR